MHIIEFQNLKKYFKGVKAVDDISFSIEEGEIFGFLGPNGAGKSTTIRCLMDFIFPTSGSIKVLSKDVTKDIVELNKVIGYVSAEGNLKEEWTGLEHIQYIASLYGISANADEYVQRLDYDPKTKVKSLSTGNRQKLSLILAFMLKPKVLVLDEPTRGMDPLVQHEVHAMLHEFKTKGGTVFISSHDLFEVEHICDRVGIIKNGKLIAVEKIQDIQEKKIYSVFIQFTDNFSKDPFMMEGVKIEKEMDHTLELKVYGDINPLLKVLSMASIQNIEITHASLEDIFLQYYKHDRTD